MSDLPPRKPSSASNPKPRLSQSTARMETVGKCPHCNYPRLGLPLHARCPECGAIPDSAPATSHDSSNPSPDAPIPLAPTRITPTPTTGRGHARSSVELILDDRLCVACGYNLKGIPARGNCPECGRAVAKSITQNRFEQGLVEAPVPWLRKLALGANLVCFSYFALFLSIFLPVFFDIPFIEWAPILISIAWAVGVFLVTNPRPVMPATRIPPKREWAKLRLATRLLNAGWLLMLLAEILEAHASTIGNSTLETSFAIASGLFLLAGFAGGILLCIYTQNLADWAGDMDLGHRFRASAFTLIAGFVASLLASIVPTFGLIRAFVIIFSILAYLVMIGYFGQTLWRFASLARWSVYNHLTKDEHEERAREKAVKAALAEQRARTQDALDAARSAQSQAPHPQRPLHPQHTIPKPAAPTSPRTPADPDDGPIPLA